MKHEFTIEGFAFRLRPIEDSDAPFVVSLRSNPLLNKYLHRSSDKIEDQLKWLASYYCRGGDYYFVIERRDNGEPEGVVSLYDINEALQCAEWGRWILKPGSLAAVESAWLVYRLAFEKIGLQYVYCRTVSANQNVVSFHDSCGIADSRPLPKHFMIDEKTFDGVEHRVSRDNWVQIVPRLQNLAQVIARKVRV